MRVTTMMESDCSLNVGQDCLDTVSKATVDETNMDVDSASTELSNRDCIDNTHEKCSVPNEKHVDGEPIEKTWGDARFHFFQHLYIVNKSQYYILFQYMYFLI